MKTHNLFIIVIYFFGLASLFTEQKIVFAENNLFSANGASSMVYDPDSKKYFIGGNAKFTLKQSENSSLIERIEVSVDGGDYQPYNGALQFTQEGKHTIKFRAVNPVNNWSPVQFVEVFVDLNPPLTEAKFQEGKFLFGVGEKSGSFSALHSSISLVAQDNLSGVSSIEYSWDNPNNFVTYSQPILVDKPGNRILYYRSTDRVGNKEATRTIEFFADGVAPTSELKTSSPLKPSNIQGRSYLTASDSVSFSLTASDEGSGVKDIWVGIDGKAPAPYLKPIYFLQEGPHVMSYYSVDRVGNQEEMKSISIYTVSAAPRTMASVTGKLVNTGGINFAKKDLQLHLAAGDNAVGLERIEYRWDSDPEFKTYMEPIRFTKGGVNTIVYRSVDRAGNVEPSRTFSVNITDTAPETAIETAQPLVVRDGVTYSPSPNIITLNVKNSGVGVANTVYSVNDGPFQNYNGPFTLTSDQRVNKVAFKSTDKLGNEELTKNLTFHMIGASPLVELFVTNEKNKEEQVRTNYFEGSNQRGVASQPQVQQQQAPAVSMPATPKPAPMAAPVKAAPRKAAPAPVSAPKPASAPRISVPSSLKKLR